jgi:regulator of protease activity HflC (stomatin/prohibitin superfamily)
LYLTRRIRRFGNRSQPAAWTSAVASSSFAWRTSAASRQARVVDEVPPQDVISRDNVSVKVNAVIYFRVVDAERAVIQVNNYLMATSQLAQTTLH